MDGLPRHWQIPAMRATLLAALLVPAAVAAIAQDSAVAALRIKAAFLYKFAAYVEWPPEVFPQPTTPLVIGIEHAEEMARELQAVVAGRKVGGRPVQVRRLAQGESSRGCCHILYIGPGGERARAAAVLEQTRGTPMLTVTDEATAHPAGSVINFLDEADRVRFDISRLSAERNGLQLRAPLLAVARQVDVP